MKWTRLRALLPAFAPALVLALSLAPAPSATAPSPLGSLPPDSTASLPRQDLAAWVARRWSPPGWIPGRPLAVSEADLAAALDEAPAPRLELFERGEITARHEVLRRLPYGLVMARICDRNHVDGLLVAAVVEAESRFEADAVSPEGAVGLMQLLPSTGQDYGVHDLFDPAANLDAGSRYLGRLLNRFSGDRQLAVAAYNTGPEVVARYGRVPPFCETQDFVHRVMASYQTHHERLAALLVPAADRAPQAGTVRLARAAAVARRPPPRESTGAAALGR